MSENNDRDGGQGSRWLASRRCQECGEKRKLFIYYSNVLIGKSVWLCATCYLKKAWGAGEGKDVH